jgi:hypothetical protein
MGKSWWIDRYGNKHCSPDWADTCHRARFRASYLHDDDVARATEAVNSIIEDLLGDHPNLKLWVVPDGLVFMDEVGADKDSVNHYSLIRGEAAVTARDDPEAIERALQLKPD